MQTRKYKTTKFETIPIFLIQGKHVADTRPDNFSCTVCRNGETVQIFAIFLVLAFALIRPPCLIADFRLRGQQFVLERRRHKVRGGRRRRLEAGQRAIGERQQRDANQLAVGIRVGTRRHAGRRR